MPERIRITGCDKTYYPGGYDNEGHDAQVDKFGNLNVREGSWEYIAKTYEDSSFTAGDSPAIHNFNADTGRNSVDGWITCDGEGDIQVDYSINGVVYSDKFTMKKCETVNLVRMNINKIRIIHTGVDSSYRIFLI